jgi:hypothetical protein
MQQTQTPPVIMQLRRLPILCAIFLGLSQLFNPLFAQKFLLLERANDPKTVRFYPGERIKFRLEGEEDYWYKRTLQDVLPESNCVMMDNYLVKVNEIAAIKRPPRTIWRITGGAFLSLGIGLTFSTTAAFIFRDSYNYPLLYGSAGALLLSSRYMLRSRTVKMGDRYRLRPMEIKF